MVICSSAWTAKFSFPWWRGFEVRHRTLAGNRNASPPEVGTPPLTCRGERDSVRRPIEDESMKKQLVIGLLAAFCATLPSINPAFAALKVGDTAPDFTAVGSLGGKDFNFNLKT